jgi:hypothetical protein
MGGRAISHRVVVGHPQTNLTNQLCDTDSCTNYVECHALTSPEAQDYDAANQSIANQ